MLQKNVERSWRGVGETLMCTWYSVHVRGNGERLVMATHILRCIWNLFRCQRLVIWGELLHVFKISVDILCAFFFTCVLCKSLFQVYNRGTYCRWKGSVHKPE